MHKSHQKSKKQLLRRAYSRSRDSLSAEEQKNKSDLISDIFIDIFGLQSTKCFFVYVDYRSEVQTNKIIDFILQQGGIVCVPAVVSQRAKMVAVQIKSPAIDLAPGFKGILEPLPELLHHCIVDAENIDVAVIPGIAFDKNGGRIGYGGGYYDRFLQNDAPQALRVGLAYKLQMISTIPMESHDIFMDYIICEFSAFRTQSQ
ncbi:5-formyltetrahydrofolate cyclo-ligase [Desulfogranum marinum]|uniref:5-formyltetrahydrofolate cyclo-ligase n=1 Tax=Desulfogranum marinum TaxID=453220 RepID=UPI0019651077|nr:5-formyltetrahydrofolate cyclo-ligase [Desulfogranum marinum]MBM9512647.1 5-formyltetrahydrofolate cyclo-ligase [Desulfogranum marinum]